MLLVLDRPLFFPQGRKLTSSVGVLSARRSQERLRQLWTTVAPGRGRCHRQAGQKSQRCHWPRRSIWSRHDHRPGGSLLQIGVQVQQPPIRQHRPRHPQSVRPARAHRLGGHERRQQGARHPSSSSWAATRPAGIVRVATPIICGQLGAVDRAVIEHAPHVQGSGVQSWAWCSNHTRSWRATGLPLRLSRALIESEVPVPCYCGVGGSATDRQLPVGSAYEVRSWRRA